MWFLQLLSAMLKKVHVGWTLILSVEVHFLVSFCCLIGCALQVLDIKKPLKLPLSDWNATKNMLEGELAMQHAQSQSICPTLE